MLVSLRLPPDLEQALRERIEAARKVLRQNGLSDADVTVSGVIEAALRSGLGVGSPSSDSSSSYDGSCTERLGSDSDSKSETNPSARGYAPTHAREGEIPATSTARGCRIENDPLADRWLSGPWPDAVLAFARTLGYDDALAESVRQEFADYWRAQPGVKGRKVDWSATARNWLRTEARRIRGTLTITSGRPRQQPRRQSAGIDWSRGRRDTD